MRKIRSSLAIPARPLRVVLRRLVQVPLYLVKGGLDGDELPDERPYVSRHIVRQVFHVQPVSENQFGYAAFGVGFPAQLRAVLVPVEVHRCSASPLQPAGPPDPCTVPPKLSLVTRGRGPGPAGAVGTNGTGAGMYCGSGC